MFAQVDYRPTKEKFRRPCKSANVERPDPMDPGQEIWNSGNEEQGAGSTGSGRSMFAHVEYRPAKDKLRLPWTSANVERPDPMDLAALSIADDFQAGDIIKSPVARNQFQFTPEGLGGEPGIVFAQAPRRP